MDLMWTFSSKYCSAVIPISAMCFGDLVVLTVSGDLLTISMVAARYFTFLVAMGVSSGRPVVEAYLNSLV